MDWISELFIEQSALQAMVVLSIICAVGLLLGKIKIWGVSLGITFVFFVGILVGHLGFQIESHILPYAQNFGLVLFVYSLGLQVGPGFFSSFRQGGISLNLMGLAVIFVGTALAILLSLFTNVSLPNMVGILCGATTNTPALGAAQQTLHQLGFESNSLALGCAITYPLGVVGVILAIIVINKLNLKKHFVTTESKEDKNQTYIATFYVRNKAIFNHSVKEIANSSQEKFVISRLWRDNQVSIPTSTKKIKEGDRLLVITNSNDVEALASFFGELEKANWNKEDIDWNRIDSQLISKRIVITRSELNGKRIGQLKLRNHYGINISRVYRSGVQLLATPDLVLQYGDRLTVVGESKSISNVERLLGNLVKDLNEPNLIVVFFGIVLGLALGAVPFFIPGISTPVKLGLAGGPIVIGLLMGTYGPRIHMITYTTLSANLMLRALGLSLYLSCLGLSSGAHFIETIVRPEGVLWVALGFVLTIVPTILVGFVSLKWFKVDFATVSGMLAGSMANPMALNYVSDIDRGDNSAVSYATVYPLCMFMRVLIAQLVLMLFM